MVLPTPGQARSTFTHLHVVMSRHIISCRFVKAWCWRCRCGRETPGGLMTSHCEAT